MFDFDAFSVGPKLAQDGRRPRAAVHPVAKPGGTMGGTVPLWV